MQPAALAASDVLPASDWADPHFLRRAAALPKLPTMQESGVKDYDTMLWTGMLAPAGTPREIVTKLNAELLVVLAKSELQVWCTFIKQAWIKLE